MKVTKVYYSWELKPIEPDAIYQKQDTLVFIDAKYKAHLYNKFDQNEALKEDHRHDVHQIMAYTSFSKTDSKFGFLCYPSDKVEVKKIQFKNGINEMANTIVVFGVPLKKNAIKEVKHLLVSVLNDLEQKH